MRSGDSCLHLSPNIILLIRLSITFPGHTVLMEEKVNAYSDMVGNPDENRPLTVPTGIWEDNIKMGPEWVAVNWIRLAQDRDM